MSEWSIEFTKSAQKQLKNVSPQIKKRLKNKILYFVDSEKPLSFATALTKPAESQYRWRVGVYRILFDADLEKKKIYVLKIQHRREVYKK